MTDEIVEVEEVEESPKVVRLGVDAFGKGYGKPYEPLPEPGPSPREEIVSKEIDEDAISLMEDVLNDYREGNIHGLALVAGRFDPNGNLVHYRLGLSRVACAYPISFMGAVESMKLDLADMCIGLNEEGGHPPDDDDDESLLIEIDG